MSGYRRRTMMSIIKKSPQEDTPVEDGLIFWLDGKDVDSNSNYWRCSSQVNAIVPTFALQISSTNTTKQQGKCMSVTGNGHNAGAHEQYGEGSTSGSGRIQKNIFYTLGYDYKHNFSFDVFFKVNAEPVSTIDEIRVVGGTNTWGDGPYRYGLSTYKGPYLRFGQNIDGSWVFMTLNTPLSVNNYYHIAITIDCVHRQATAYVNGVLDSIKINSYGCPSNSPANNAIGLARYSGLQNNEDSVIGNYYSLAYYNKVLTENEVSQNYEFYKNRYIE